VLRNHLLKGVGGGGDPITHVSNTFSTTRDGGFSIGGSFLAGDVLVFSVAVSLENTAKSLSVGTTATVDGNSATLIFADTKLGITDERYVQTFRYTFTASSSGSTITWTGLSAGEISGAGFDIQLSKAAVVVRNADPVPYATNNFVLDADATKTINENNGGYLYLFRSSFDDDGRGSSWGVTQPSSQNSVIGVFSNEIVIGNYWTNRSNGTASFSFTEPTSEPHWLIGHIVALEPL
jgi:hypothetical protein